MLGLGAAGMVVIPLAATACRTPEKRRGDTAEAALW
jgi:hypothetical protein